jgi:hypothetical protein
MRPPRGVLKPGQEGKVCCLLKGLYRLKQAGRGWYQEFTKVMVNKLGFKRSALDHSVFCRKHNEEHTVVAVATDDMALTSKQKSNITKLKSEISQHWEITDGGEMRWYLGFAIKQDRVAQTISINQQAYIEAMLNKFRLTNARPVSMPMEAGAQFTKDQGPSTPTQAIRMCGAIYRGNWMCAMAGYDNMTGLCIRGRNPVPIHPESRQCPLGGTKTGHGLFRVDKGPVAHLWWTEPKACRRILRFRLCKSARSSLNSGICLPFWPWSSMLELKKAANNCSLDSRSRVCCSSSRRERGAVAARFR